MNVTYSALARNGMLLLPSFRWSVSVLSLAAASLLPCAARAAEIFVTYAPTGGGSGQIGAYTTSGATINADLVPDSNSPEGLTSAGSDLYVANESNGTIGQYTISGATVNASLVSGLSTPVGVAVSGSDVFVADPHRGVIGEYTTSGTTVNASLISGLSYPVNVAVSGSDIFVVNLDSGTNPNGTIQEYTTSGVPINTSLIQLTDFPEGIAISGSDLFVSLSYVFGGNSIGEYTTSGATVNANLIQGLDNPRELAIFGSDLFVTNEVSGTVGEYTTSGTTVNASLISGLNDVFGITVVPEPSSISLLALGGFGLAFFVKQRNRDRNEVSRRGVAAPLRLLAARRRDAHLPNPTRKRPAVWHVGR